MCSRPAWAAPVVSRNATSSVSTAPSTRAGCRPSRASSAGPSISDAGDGSLTANVPIDCRCAVQPRNHQRIAPAAPAARRGDDAGLCRLLRIVAICVTTMSFWMSRTSCGRIRPGPVGKTNTRTPDLRRVGGAHLAQSRRECGVAGTAPGPTRVRVGRRAQRRQAPAIGSARRPHRQGARPFSSPRTGGRRNAAGVPARAAAASAPSTRPGGSMTNHAWIMTRNM